MTKPCSLACMTRKGPFLVNIRTINTRIADRDIITSSAQLHKHTDLGRIGDKQTVPTIFILKLTEVNAIMSPLTTVSISVPKLHTLR